MNPKKKINITYDEFKKYIEKIIANEEYIDKLSALDINIWEHLTYSELCVRLLEKLVDDEDAGWISWWLWENEMGKGELQVFDKNDKEIPSQTIKDLWNLITTE